MQNQWHQRITLGITGASGAPYAIKLLRELINANCQIYLIVSNAAKVVLATEVEEHWPDEEADASRYFEAHYGAQPGQVVLCGRENWFTAPASGSAAPKMMVICPCSMGTLSAIAHGSSDNLLERAADVVIKERGQLLLVPRESPFSPIHLENMLKLARLGITIMPAAPGFYHQPTTLEELVDFMVARVLDHLSIPHRLSERWGVDNG